MISRKDLAKALRVATTRLRKGAINEVQFSVVDGLLEIAGPHAGHLVDFQGAWPSAVVTDAAVLKKVASRLPSGDSLALRAENSRLFIGTFSIDARILGAS